MAKKDWTRQELIELCQQSIVPQSRWNSSSKSACLDIGRLWALLQAECCYVVDDTTWQSKIAVIVAIKEAKDSCAEIETFYLDVPKC